MRRARTAPRRCTCCSTSRLFAAFAWVALQVADAREAQNIVLWFVAAIVLHDLVLLPFYSAIDRVGRAGLPRGRRSTTSGSRAALSALLLLLFFPPILGRNDGSLRARRRRRAVRATSSAGCS